MRRILTLAMLLVSFVCLPFLSTFLATPAEAAPAPCVYAPPTGHYLCGAFRQYWDAFGGLAVFGYPITEAVTDPNTHLLTQWFERARFELHPGADPTHFDVELGLLGVQVGVTDPNQTFFRPATKRSTANCTYFPATKHNLCGGFYAYWQKFGGLGVYGMPISEEFQEHGVTVQYFERQRFEWHPGEWPARFDVELGLLGDQLHNVDAPLPPPVTKPLVTQDERIFLNALDSDVNVIRQSMGRFSSFWDDVEYDSSMLYNQAWQSKVVDEFNIWISADKMARQRGVPPSLATINAKWVDVTYDLTQASYYIALGGSTYDLSTANVGITWYNQAVTNFGQLMAMLDQFNATHQW